MLEQSAQIIACLLAGLGASEATGKAFCESVKVLILCGERNPLGGKSGKSQSVHNSVVPHSRSVLQLYY